MSWCVRACVCVCACAQATYLERIAVEWHVHVMTRLKEARNELLFVACQIRFPCWVAGSTHDDPFVFDLLKTLLPHFEAQLLG